MPVDDPPPSAVVTASSSKRPRGGSRSGTSKDLEMSGQPNGPRDVPVSHAAMHDMTTFADLTDPPVDNSLPETKGLAGDIQGGLSGLYNKLKASVSNPKDTTAVTLPPPALDTTRLQVERSNSQNAQSGRASRMQSPRPSTHDSSLSTDALPGFRVSNKSAPTSKLSLPQPLLRSPEESSFPVSLLDPSAHEGAAMVNSKLKAHSRGASLHDPEVNTLHSRISQSTSDAQASSVALSHTEQDALSSVHDRRLQSPTLTPLTKIDTQRTAPSHERGASESSTRPSRSKSTNQAMLSPLKTTTEGAQLKEAVVEQLAAIPPKEPTNNPLLYLADHDSHGQATTLHANTKGPKPYGQRLGLATTKQQPSMPRVNQARLPGYQASKGSSTDSLRTDSRTALSGIEQRQANGHVDGSDEPGHLQSSSRLRGRLISKEFWMKDENARDCFRCGLSFTAFRRKHHCRTCGQIFDNKCTTLVSGSFFDTASPVRVCKPCEAIVTTHDDDSSDYSIDDAPMNEHSARPVTPEPNPLRYDDDNASVVSQSVDPAARTPTMSLPVRRAYDENSRSSAVLEFDTMNHVLQRPGSSRSLRTSHSHALGHKRHHSRHQHIRTYKAYHDDRAPFQRRTVEDLKHQKESAFHRDSVIDPELSQYLSDDASSGDEMPLHITASNDKLSRSGPDSDRTTIGGLLAAVRKGRSRMGDRSIAGFLTIGRDADDAASIISSRAIDGGRPSRKRNLSVASSIHHRLTPKGTRERLHLIHGAGHDGEAPASPAFPPLRASRMIRSASMRGAGAPHLELNRASYQHVHDMLEQLLKDADVVKVSSWKEALIPILLRATDDVDPDVQAGDDIDIRNYVKLKKIPGGRPSDSSYISGLVFTKNVALKSMSRSIINPRILIITFPLEYARSEQHFMSLDPVIRQEKEYLENIVGRIAALRPDVLLAQRNISGLALGLLDKANIATIYNIRPSILEAVSRCTQTRVNHSMEKLSLVKDQLGICDSFEVKTFVFEGRRKTYIYLSGCPPQLGCTIALRGADRKLLAKIKRLTDFMIYVVYNLKLETCLMRDEWARIPGNDELVRSSMTAGNVQSLNDSEKAEGTAAENRPSQELAESNEESKTVGTGGVPQSNNLEQIDSFDIPEDIPVPTFYEDLADKHQTKILSASPFVRFAQPYLLMRARELERKVAYLKRLRDQDTSDANSVDEKAKAQKFILIQPEMVHTTLKGASKKVKEIVHAVHDAEYDKALYHYETQKKQWEAYLSGNRNLFDPYAHQNIVVLFSQISNITNIPCLGPDLLAFSFYNEHEHEDDFEADCTLGQYVEDLCYRAEDICTSEACGKPMYDHSRSYVHGEGQISVQVRPHPPKLRGLQDVILMWSICNRCALETTVVPMSPSTWKYSFGKYLELSFWSADLHARAGVCPHDLHRDHTRYFGFKDIAITVAYVAISPVEVIVPRMRITWKVDNDLRFRNAAFSKLELRITKFMVSVKLRLKSINVDALLTEAKDAEDCGAEVERLINQANEDHSTVIKQLQDLYTKSKHWEIIPFNRAMRTLQEKVADWDNIFYKFEQTYFPSEKDISKMATLQLKKIFLDRDVSVTSLTPNEDDSSVSGANSVSEKAESPESDTVTRKLSPEKTQNVLQSVLEEHAGSEEKQELTTEAGDNSLENKMPIVAQSDPIRRTSTDLKHLDLAVAEATPTPNSPFLRPPLDRGQISSGGESDKTITLANDASVPEPSESKDINESSEVVDHTSTLRNTSIRSLLPTPTPPSRARRTSTSRPSSPQLLRTHSQPSGSIPLHKEIGFGKSNTSSTSAGSRADPSSSTASIDSRNEGMQKKLSDHFQGLKNSKFVKGQSLIPRAISNRKESRVSNLAKHFEQLSREFERERVRERRLRTAHHRQSRAYPIAAPKPIVEVYKDVYEAVEEPTTSEDALNRSEVEIHSQDVSIDTTQGLAETNQSTTAGDGYHAEGTPTDHMATENETELPQSSQAPSDADDASEDQESDIEAVGLPDSPEDLLRLSQEDVDLKELPKHERTSVLKMLSNFWAERSASGWSTLEYPFHASDHLFTDCDIIVREDELSSIIAFALDSADYKSVLDRIQSHAHAAVMNAQNAAAELEDVEAEVMHSLLRKTGSHFRYMFQEGPAKMMCKIFFAEQFSAMRRKCGVADRFVESLSRCMKFDSRGGKSKSIFLKTLDDRFVLKSLSPVETQSFLKFAPNYFQIMSEAFFHELPSVIAKMLGFYQVVIKNPVTGVEHNWFLLVMENLFYDRTPKKIFDLKGSMRNRRTNENGDPNEVLLDENMVDYIYETPIFAREHSKKLLRSSVHNDTLFLARQNVMDYSLMIAIDEARGELVVGIIDCIRTYTWDKKLESWIKDRGFAGGGKNKPTVTSPKEYKKRFREAMSRYVLEAPNCWHQFRPVRSDRRQIKGDGTEKKDRDGGDEAMQTLT